MEGEYWTPKRPEKEQQPVLKFGEKLYPFTLMRLDPNVTTEGTRMSTNGADWHRNKCFCDVMLKPAVTEMKYGFKDIPPLHKISQSTLLSDAAVTGR